MCAALENIAAHLCTGKFSCTCMCAVDNIAVHVYTESLYRTGYVPPCSGGETERAAGSDHNTA